MRCHVTSLVSALSSFFHFVAILSLLSSAEAAPATIAKALAHDPMSSIISPRRLLKPSGSCAPGHVIYLDGRKGSPPYPCSKDDLVDSNRQKGNVNVRRSLEDVVQNKSGNSTADTQWPTHVSGGFLNLEAGEVPPASGESEVEHKQRIEQVKEGEKELVNHERQRAERLRKDIEDLKEKEKKRQEDVMEREQKAAERAYYDIAVKESMLRSFNGLIRKVDRLRDKTMGEREQGIRDIIKSKFQKRAVQPHEGKKDELAET